MFSIAVLLISLYSCLPVKRQKQTYATFLKHIPMRSGGDNLWEFYDKGKRYTVFAWEPYKHIPGDKYIIVYDSLKPDRRFEIQPDRPFLRSAK